MTPVNPPYCLQAVAAKHPAQLFRQAISSLLPSAGGLLAAAGLAVSQKGTPNMSVEVLGGTPAQGGIWVPGTTVAGTQGLYYCWNEATYNVPIEASGATNPRIDIIVARVKDEAYAGGVNEWTIEAVKGVETAGATLANRSGVAATPASSIILAYVLVPAKATTIVTADIENVATPFQQPVRTKSNSLPSFMSWGMISGAGAIEVGSEDYTVAKPGTGEYVVTWKTEKTSAKYAVVVLGNEVSAAEVFLIQVKSFTIKLREAASLKNGLFCFIVIATN